LHHFNALQPEIWLPEPKLGRAKVGSALQIWHKVLNRLRVGLIFHLCLVAGFKIVKPTRF